MIETLPPSLHRHLFSHLTRTQGHIAHRWWNLKKNVKAGARLAHYIFFFFFMYQFGIFSVPLRPILHYSKIVITLQKLHGIIMNGLDHITSNVFPPVLVIAEIGSIISSGWQSSSEQFLWTLKDLKALFVRKMLELKDQLATSWEWDFKIFFCCCYK